MENKSIVISGLTEQIDQYQLYQLIELVGSIESIQYSEDNKHMQVNYQSNESAEKAVKVLQNIQLNNVPLTIQIGTIESLNLQNTPIIPQQEIQEEIDFEEKEHKEMKQNNSINWNSIKKCVDDILSIPVQIDEKIHFTEYCALGLTLAVSKCEQINHDYQISSKIENGINSIICSLSDVFNSFKNSINNSNETKEMKEEKEENNETLENNDSNKINEETNEMKEEKETKEEEEPNENNEIQNN